MNSISQNIIKHKVGLLNLAAELGNVSRACKVMGFSRDTFYRYQSAVESGGVEALIDSNRRKPNLRNRVDDVVKMQLKRLQLNSRHSAKSGFPMNCVGAAYLFRPLACVQSGYGTTWSHSKSGCQP